MGRLNDPECTRTVNNDVLTNTEKEHIHPAPNSKSLRRISDRGGLL